MVFKLLLKYCTKVIEKHSYLSFLINSFLLFFILIVSGSCNRNGAENNEKDKPLPYYKDPSFEPIWYKNTDEALKNNKHSLIQFDLINQNGEDVNETILQGKIHVAGFFTTQCKNTCVVKSTQMQKLQAVFKNDSNVVLVFYSMNPKYDKPEILKSFGSLHNAKLNKWLLLTGNRHELYNLALRFYYAEGEEGISKVQEELSDSDNFILVDKNGFIRGIYNATRNEEMEKLMHDVIKLSVDEAD